MTTNIPGQNFTFKSLPEGGALNDGSPLTHREMPVKVTSSNQPSTPPSTRRLLAVAAPGREDLVILVDTSPLRLPLNAPPSSPLDETMSPERRFLDRDEATPRDERICTQLWALWAALTFPLLLSSWLLLIPFLISSKDNAVTEAPRFPSARPPSVPATTLSSPFPTAQTTAATGASTPFSWQGIPPACLSPATPATEPSSYMAGPHAAGVPTADRSQRPIFCLFDNAKVNVSLSSRQPFYYMFETLPFALCPNVVYSSVGIADGQLVSRLPLFEQKHGLSLLRQIVNEQGFQDTRILLVLGGRKEDAPHFWRLGRDPNTFDLLMKNVVDGMIKFQLDGVTVHWMEPTSNCSGTDHDLVLSILLHRLKETFAKHGLTRHVVSVMLDMRADNRYLLNSVANVVNYFFIGTNVLRYTGRGPFQDICANLSRAARVVISSYSSFSKNVGADQLCVMVQLAPWGALGFELPTGAWMANGTLRRALLDSACSQMSTCRKDAGNASCIAHLTYYSGNTTLGARNAAIFLVPNIDALKLLSGINSSAPSTTAHACVLLLDLHRDNYARQCGMFMQYVLMEHFYRGIVGQRRRNQSIIDAAPLCQVPKFG